MQFVRCFDKLTTRFVSQYLGFPPCKPYLYQRYLYWIILENAKRMEELERKNSLKKAAYELSKVTATHSPTTNVTCSANHGPPTTTSSGGTIEQNVMPPSMSTPAQKNLIRRFSWENVDHKNSLKSLWDNNK